MDTTTNNDDNNFALCEAAQDGDEAKVARLVQLCDPSWCENAALREAVENNHVGCVQLLIPKSQPHENDSWAMRDAAKYGYFECLKLLLPVSDPRDLGETLENAARAGCAHSVAFVLEYIDDLHTITGALEVAAVNSHHDCVDVLYPKADVSLALHNLKTYYSHYQDEWLPLYERYNAEQQKIVLTTCVDTSKTTATRRAKI